MKQHNKRRGIIASVGALVTAAALALGGAAAAQAVPPALPAATDVVITYTDASPPAGAGNGTSQSVTGNPIVGAEFSAYKVLSVDMNTNLGQQAAAGMSVAEALSEVGNNAANYTQTTGSTAPNEGVATFDALAPGLYLFKETTAQLEEGVLPAAPFLVAVPMTDPDDPTKWLSTIHAYPKQSSASIVKTLDANGAQKVGDSVTWTLENSIPTVLELSQYQITDTLATGLTTTTSDVTVTVKDDTGTEVAPAITGYTIDVTGQVVTVTFDAAGRAALAALPADSHVYVEIITEITAQATGTIENSATLKVNGGLVTSGTESLHIGEIKIDKLSDDPSVTGAALNGAVFDLYKADAVNSSGVWVGGTALATGLTTATIGADHGVVLTSENLVLSADETTGKTYYLVETTALTGHQLLTGPVKVDVTFAPGGSWNDTNNVYTVQVTNLSSSGFVLPLTGGMGTAFLTVIGLAIVGFVVFMARRRRSEEAAN